MNFESGRDANTAKPMPKTAIVKRGGSVTWKDTGTVPHSATGPWGDIDLSVGQSYTSSGPGTTTARLFKTRGTYHYFDELYPSHKGTIVIR